MKIENIVHALPKIWHEHWKEWNRNSSTLSHLKYKQSYDNLKNSKLKDPLIGMLLKLISLSVNLTEKMIMN